MIIAECGRAMGPDQLREQLLQCGAQVAHSYQLIPGIAAGLTPDALKKFFARYPNARVMPDRRRQIPPMPFGPDEWAEVAGPRETLPTSPGEPEISPYALTLMKADEVHALGIDGAEVRVCIIDSGVDFGHPDLQGTALIGPDGNPLAADFTETDLTDTVGHGTAVAGCVVAQARQVYTITDEQSGAPAAYTRIKGVAPGVRLMSAKVFDTRVASGYDSAIIAALEWAAENGAHIVNMSLGGSALPNDGSDPLAAAVTALRDRGILVTVSAGNAGGGHGTLKSPGSSLGALTVGASTMYRSFAELGFLAEPGKWTADQLAAFSSLGPSADGRLKPDILAPGAFCWGLAPTVGSEEGQTFQLFGGTSQAAPLMAGAAALLYQAYHKANGRFPTPDEAIRILQSTADDLGLPAHMQGAGRVNCLRAVQAVSGGVGTIIVSAPRPISVSAGGEATVTCEVANLGAEASEIRPEAVRFEPAPDLSVAFNGQITLAQSTQHITFDVARGTDLMQVSLDWPSEDHSPTSARLMVALYDPEGRFVNYQRPNSSGDVELGKSVDCWVARPAAGRWTARIVLRLGVRDTVQPFTLSVRAFRRTVWSWVDTSAGAQSLTPGETRQIDFTIRVPVTATAATYAGHIMIAGVAVPVSVVVPISLERGKSAFSGTFQHGYQGTWGNGDWLYHDLPIPAGTRSVIASIQWPDVDNALECYLIDPHGSAIMGRANNADILDDGDSDVMGGQLMLANPEPGTWRIALHSFAFCGRGLPEPYSGYVEVGGELVSPRTIHMQVAGGAQAPLAILVRNPGRMPLTIKATAQSNEPRLIWRTVNAEVKSGVDAEGRAVGEGGHVTLASVQVPPGARQAGCIISWDQSNVEVSLSLFDPVAQNDRSTVSSSQGQVMVFESNPVPGEWTIMAGVTSAEVQQQTVRIKGATFIVAPHTLENVTAEPVTVQPGSHALVPLTVRMPENTPEIAGQIIVTSTEGDQLGIIPFRIQVDSQDGTNAEVATTKE